MLVHRIESGPLYTNCYIVADEVSRRAVVIDAPYGCAAGVEDYAERERLTIEQILLTHSHWDHTADAAELRTRFHAPVMVHARDEYRMQRPFDSIIPPPFPLAAMNADAYLDPQHAITVGSHRAAILFTPGHTEGSVCFYFEHDAMLFSGDTLFAGSVGRTDLPGGSWPTLIASLKNTLAPLPSNVHVLPGHGPATTMERELLSNPFLNGEIGE